MPITELQIQSIDDGSIMVPQTEPTTTLRTAAGGAVSKLHHKTGQIIALPLLIANALCWMILMRHIDSAWLTSSIALLFPQIH